MIKTVIFDNSKIYIEGYKDIDSFSEEQFVISAKNYSITICGSNLVLEKFSNNSLKICGNILKIQYI